MDDLNIKTKPSDVAFPTNQILNDCDGNKVGEISHSGLTKIEYFSIKILSNSLGEKSEYKFSKKTYMEKAFEAVEQAQALIEVLNKLC